MHFHSDAANPLAVPPSAFIYPMHPAISYAELVAGKSVAYNVSISQFAVIEVENSSEAVISV